MPITVLHARLRAFFYCTGFFENTVQYHSDLSDQSAVEISVRVELHYFSIFHGE